MGDNDQLTGTTELSEDQQAVKISPGSAASLRRTWLDRRRRIRLSATRGARGNKPGPPEFNSAPYTGHIHPAARKDGSKYSPSGWHNLSSTNIYGLTSRSERFFPEAFRPIQDKFWREIDDAERFKLIEAQALAMKKVGFRDTEDFADNSTIADTLYEEALGRRRQAIRRRLSFRPPKKYEERKKWEAEKAKQPLVRRYVSRDLEQLEDISFYKAGPLEIPVLIQGVLKRLNQVPEAAPKRLKLKRPKYQQETTKLGEARLPESIKTGAPMIGINMWNNRFGLQSSAVSKYPEAYREVSSVFWRQVGRGQREQVMLVQAQAMEKVGFERKTEKFFIKDFDPTLENLYGLDSETHSAGELGSTYGSTADSQYDPANEGLTLQNRFSSQEFVPGRLKDLGFRLIKPANLPIGVVLLTVSTAVLVLGINNGMNPLLWLIAIGCGIIGSALALSLVRS